MKKIFYNGTILTMESEPFADAVLVDGATIEKVGNLNDLQLAAPQAKLVDLAHKTMMPAFLDAHSHFSSYANAQLQVSLEGSASFDEIGERIFSFVHATSLQPGQWVVANGYDHNTLAEKRHPTRELLDRILPNHPLVLQHQSGHCGVLNSKALALLSITPQTHAPVGGVIGCSNGKLTGYLEEEAYIHCIKQVPMADLSTMLSAYRKAQKKYLSYGITTVQEGMMVAQMLPLYTALLESGLLTVDLIGYSDVSSLHALTAAFPHSVKKLDRHFKIGGYKIILDGSPQVKTAWMKTPYLGGQNCGYGTMSDEAVFAAVEQATSDGMQIMAHCNGDAAVQQYLNAVKKVAAKNNAILALRPVIIHAQFLAKNQLPMVAQLHMLPSFFLAHVLHWGDVHIKNCGYDRAQFISPARSALQNGVIFTFHQDAPVIEPNMLETIQCAVTRTTKEGVLLGKDECLDVLDALKAVTINVAYQYFEETTHGSIKEGKHADFVLLSDNPLTVPKDKLTDILVLETIKDGQTVFCLEKDA